MEWKNKTNLVIKKTVLPDAKFEGYLAWKKLCDLANAGEIPTVDNYTIYYYVGGRIWCTAGYAKTLEDAILIANKINPAPFDGGISDGYMLTSTGEIVLADDWDEIEGFM